MLRSAMQKNEEQQGVPKAQQLNEGDKNMLRENIFEAAVRAPTKNVRATFGEAINHISQHMIFQSKWTNLLPQILSGCQSGDITRMTNSITICRKLLKNYEFRSRERRQTMDLIVNQTFPTLLQILSQVVNQQFTGGDRTQIDAAGDICRLICKCVWSSSMFIVAPYLKNRDNLMNWMGNLNLIVKKDVEMLLPPKDEDGDDEERNKYVWIKAKKWAMKFFHRIFSRFGNTRYVEQEDKEFSKMFLNELSVPIMESCLNQISLRASGKFCSNRCMMEGISYLGCAAEMGITWKVLKPHMDTILFQICFPILYFNNQDYLLWTEEPHEYIRKSFDPMEDYIDPRSAVITLFLDLAKLRYKSTVPKILNFCNEVLTKYTQVQNPNDKPYREKEGVMGVLGALHEYLISKKATRNAVEPLLITHILPEFQSPHGFIRARACWVVQQFAGDVIWQNRQAQVQSAQSIVNCLADPGITSANSSSCCVEIFNSIIGGRMR